MNPVLQLEGLSVGYGQGAVVKDVNCSLYKGELCALLGSNGSGKSTLLRGICGLLPTKGAVQINGKSVQKMGSRERARTVGYLAQGGRLSMSLGVMDVVLMGVNPVLGLLESPSISHRRRAMEVLEQVGMAHLSERAFQTLSEGQKQMVLLARTILCQPGLLVLDEPDSALDFTNRDRMFRVLKGYLCGEDRAGLMCSHDVNTALCHTDRLLLLKDGEVAHDLPQSDLSIPVLQRALEDVYGPVEVLCHKGRFIMIGGERNEAQTGDQS